MSQPKVTSLDVQLFSRQLYTLLKSGVPIMRGLAGLQESCTNKTFAHVLQDYREGPEGSKRGHFEEWVALAEDENIGVRTAQDLIDIDYSIHFHVWTQAEFLELLSRLMSELRFTFDVEATVKNGIELIAILRKHSDAPPAIG